MITTTILTCLLASVILLGSYILRTKGILNPKYSRAISAGMIVSCGIAFIAILATGLVYLLGTYPVLGIPFLFFLMSFWFGVVYYYTHN